MKPLADMRVLSLAVNLPGPVAAARLRQLGAAVVKVEPPEGDPLAHGQPEWYRVLHEGVEVIRLDLKDRANRTRLDELLAASDLLLTATRPAALARLGLAWADLKARYPRLAQVAIVGYAAPYEEVPGHDLTYQARLGLVVPPHLPRALVADLAGAQEVVSAALALILARERGQGCHYTQVSLAEAAGHVAESLRYGLTVPNGLLGGGLAGYNLYPARDGWIALAALEPHFWHQLGKELGLAAPGRAELQQVFLTRTAGEWEAWGRERDLPLAAVRDPEPVPKDPL
jgi:crotonobetainyl-CoA:carnitine CoA-transferase CaiB-like acyl-CoA transferase